MKEAASPGIRVFADYRFDIAHIDIMNAEKPEDIVKKHLGPIMEGIENENVRFKELEEELEIKSTRINTVLQELSDLEKEVRPYKIYYDLTKEMKHGCSEKISKDGSTTN